LKKNILFILLLWSVFQAYGQTAKEILYVGTYSVRGSEGIYVYEFNRKKENFELIQTVNTPESPSFITVHPSGKFLLSVNRAGLPGNPNTGSVSAFRIEASTGKLTLINHQPSYGSGPCHISTDHTGKLAFVSNYTEGNVIVFPIAADGALKACSDSVRFSGKSINPTRQEKPHAHSSLPSPDNRFLLATDLGTDRIYSYTLNIANGKIVPAQKPFISVEPGSGPRHFTFHPNGRFVYLVEELTSTVAVFSYNKKTGDLTLIQDQIKSLPDDFKSVNTAADIHTDAKGKYLFLSNRGHQSLAVFDILADGNVKFKFTQPVAGEKPRNFLVDPQNQFVWVANQDTDNIIMLALDDKNGKLQETTVQIKVPSPVCLKMLRLD
jgi:6-phosphogluconolactonase